MALGMRVNRVVPGASSNAPFNWQTAKKAILEASAETIFALVKANGGSIRNLMNLQGLAYSAGGPGGGDEPGSTTDPNNNS